MGHNNIAPAADAFCATELNSVTSISIQYCAIIKGKVHLPANPVSLPHALKSWSCMRILIDFTPIPVDRAGAGVYAENLIREIAVLLHPDDSLFLLIQDDELVISRIVRNVANIEILSVPSRLFRNRLALMLYEQCVLPWVLLKRRIDVIHSLHYMHPIFSPATRVVTVHDLTHSLMPDLHTRGRRLLIPIFAKRAVKHAEGGHIRLYVDPCRCGAFMVKTK